MKTVFAAALGAALWAAAGVALAGPSDDYVKLHAAELLDVQCKALKYVEHTYLVDAQILLLEQTGEWGGLQSGKFTEEQYRAWVDERHAEAQSLADATGGCTPQAEQYLINAREQASALIAQGMMLALHFDTLAETDPDRHLLAADEKQAIMAYSVFLQQVYGANYQQFMAFQRQQAVAQLPLVGNMSEPDDIYTFDSFAFRSDEDIEKVREAQRRAVRVTDLVLFEVMAETNGWRVLPEHLEGGWIIPTLQRGDATGPEDRLVVVQGPARYALADYSTTYNQLLARAPDGSVKLMIYGEAASVLQPTPSARLYIPSMPLPQGKDHWSWFNDPTFRDTAMVWDGEPMTGPCLGGPCFDFPPEVSDAIGRRGEQGQVELFISNDPAAQPAPIELGSYRSGRIASRHFFALMGR